MYCGFFVCLVCIGCLACSFLFLEFGEYSKKVRRISSYRKWIEGKATRSEITTRGPFVGREIVSVRNRARISTCANVYWIARKVSFLRKRVSHNSAAS